MLIYYPEYYNKFKCIAGRCPDTCCAKWQIVVDGDSARRYSALGGSFGERLRSSMTVDGDGDTVFINQNNRCPFLNSGNLCDIYINIGEEQLCRTCARYPRFSTAFGGSEELGLLASCPAAAELILTQPTFPLESDFDDRDPDINELDAELYLMLKQARKGIIDFINSAPITAQTLRTLWDYAGRLQAEIDSERFDVPQISAAGEPLNTDEGLFEKFEYLTAEGRQILTKTKLNPEPELKVEHKNLLFYYIYRYFLSSAYDAGVRAALRTAVFAVQTVASLKLPAIEGAVLFAKEIEHSAENLRILAQN